MRSYIGVVRTTGAEVSISFPDVPGPEGTGLTIEEARGNASRALAGHLRALIEGGGSVPPPSSLIEVISAPEWQAEAIDAVILAIRPVAR
jgi:predicted RNase H-like HicB family nuclease